MASPVTSGGGGALPPLEPPPHAGDLPSDWQPPPLPPPRPKRQPHPRQNSQNWAITAAANAAVSDDPQLPAIPPLAHPNTHH